MINFEQIEEGLATLANTQGDTTKAPDVAPEFEDILDRYEISEGLTEKAEIKPDQKVSELVPLVRYVDGVGGRSADFLCCGTLSLITGQKGCRKSTFMRALCKVLLNGRLTGSASPDTLTALKSGLKIALIDTEQHESRVKRTYDYLQRDYNGKAPLRDVLRVYCGRGLGAEGLCNLSKSVCHTFKPDVLIIDVAAHLIDDVNDQKTAKQLVDYLNRLMSVYGCAIVGVIHQNQSRDTTENDRPTGAVGTKLLQAAEITLSVVRVSVGDSIIIHGKKADGFDNPNALQTGITENCCSYVHFMEYRERYPQLPDFLIKNRQNEFGGWDVDLLPVDIDARTIATGEKAGNGKAVTKKFTYYYATPAADVTATAERIKADEQAREYARQNQTISGL